MASIIKAKPLLYIIYDEEIKEELFGLCRPLVLFLLCPELLNHTCTCICFWFVPSIPLPTSHSSPFPSAPSLPSWVCGGRRLVVSGDGSGNASHCSYIKCRFRVKGKTQERRCMWEGCWLPCLDTQPRLTAYSNSQAILLKHLPHRSREAFWSFRSSHWPTHGAGDSFSVPCQYCYCLATGSYPALYSTFLCFCKCH